jgi:hypothetical protein
LPRKGVVLGATLSAVVFSGIRFTRRRWIVARVHGASMHPLLADGATVILARHARCNVGDVVLFRVSERDYPDYGGVPVPNYRIKLVTAVAGDPAPDALPPSLYRQHHGRVPDGHIAVGGTRGNSEGSNRLGYIELSRVEGVARSSVFRVRRSQREAAWDA